MVPILNRKANSPPPHLLTVDPGEALDDDGTAPQVARLERRVFTTAALAVVVVSDHHPRLSAFLRAKLKSLASHSKDQCWLPDVCTSNSWPKTDSPTHKFARTWMLNECMHASERVLN